MSMIEKYLEALKDIDGWVIVSEWATRFGELYPELLEKAKAEAAMRWCQHASKYSESNRGKPWGYLLIPHDEVNESKRLEDFSRFIWKE